ncbi:MAG: TIGR02921 family PEP-CTERM protein [Pseudomonadota bacterium]
MKWIAPRNKVTRIACYSTFWGWNITFLSITLFGIIPLIGMQLSLAVLQGDLPLDLLISLIFLVLVPIISLGIAYKKFKGRPYLQIRLFYGVEAPLFLLGLIRLFIIRELTLASIFLIVSIVASTFIYGYFLLRNVSDENRSSRKDAPLSALLLIISLYVGTILAFYAVPLAWGLLSFLFQFSWLIEIYKFVTMLESWKMLFSMLWWFPFAVLLFSFSIALFIGSPIAIILFYVSIWWKKVKHIGWKYAAVTTTSVVAIWLTCFILVNKQPQQQVFTWFEEQGTPSPAEHKAFLVKNQDEIREGLINAYLYPYRYFSVKGRVNHISKIYSKIFGGNRDNYEWLDPIYRILISPILYDGKKGDNQKAVKLYAEMFDSPIQRTEREAILSSVSATWDRMQVEAGLLNINQQQVWIKAQSITTTQQQMTTDVEIYEVYENKTPDRQEIFYYFSLPPNSAITGLWLGESGDRSKAQPFIVSPRGAAQKVYKRQVRRLIDPALLEQVGPRQYRLRAFPIPPRQLTRRAGRFFGSRTTISETDEQPNIHLWLTYNILNQKNVEHIFPNLLEKRNVYWDEDSQRTLNGTEFENDLEWMPSLQSKSEDFVTMEAGTISSADGNIYKVTASIFNQQLDLTPISAAVLIDSSYSMHQKKEELYNSLNFLKGHAKNLDIYVHPINEERTSLSSIDDVIYYGLLTDSDLWNRAASISMSANYDVVFVLTDQGSYELSKENPEMTNSVGSNIWFVHLDKLAPAYQDSVMRELMSYGGVASTVKEAWQQYLLNKSLPSFQQVDNRILWDFGVCDENAESLTVSVKNNTIAAVMAAKLIDHLARCQKDKQSLAFLDNLHSIAKTNNVVTLYSSMIVLINDRQKEQLKNAEQNKDRFDRPIDSGIKTLNKPVDLLVSGVPEPEEWLLIIIACAFLYRLRSIKCSGDKTIC